MSNVDALRNLAADPRAIPDVVRRALDVQGSKERRLRSSATAEVSVVEHDGAQHPLVSACLAAFQAARDAPDHGGLPEGLLKLPGMSGRRYRRFINSLVHQTPNARYLEVGSWAGSTLSSAIWNNRVQATAIDNWTQFGGPAAAFFRHVGLHLGAGASVSVLAQDFRRVRFDAIGKFNIYLFDGPHEVQDQMDGLLLAAPALDEVFVLIIDDWNWPGVRAGTDQAIESLELKRMLTIEVRTTLHGEHANEAGQPLNEKSDWHNGYFIGVLAKGT